MEMSMASINSRNYDIATTYVRFGGKERDEE
jgi:hypothetical protein